MSEITARESAILYRNTTDTVFLIDIPRSIELAQGSLADVCTRRILSAPALESPFQCTEPASPEARAKLARAQGLADENFPLMLLTDALTEIRLHWTHEWSLPRWLGPSIHDEPARELMCKGPKKTWSAQDSIVFSAGSSHQYAMHDIEDRLVFNAMSDSSLLCNLHDTQKWTIPPQSAFLWSFITDMSALNFSMAALARFPTGSAYSKAGPGQFDMIVLDPPWQNKSVRRSRHYSTARTDQDPMDILQTILGQHIGPDGIVACWVTNSPKSLAVAKETFEVWGLTLFERWIWLKVTLSGETSSKIDSSWKRPYEILLVGRKSCDLAQVPVVINRTIVAVPDIHSRKPHLKEMFEKVFPSHVEARVLEIFARQLTAGWVAWGDEVLKYADSSQWSEDLIDHR